MVFMLHQLSVSCFSLVLNAHWLRTNRKVTPVHTSRSKEGHFGTRTVVPLAGN
jgi:hypothetical protein